MAINKWLSGLAAAAVREAIITWVIPPGFGLVTAIAGYAQGLPWAYILVTGSLGFAAMGHGMLRFSEWIDRRAVKDKIFILQGKVCQHPEGLGFVLGVHVQSSASIPVEIDVEELETSIGDRIPADRRLEHTKITVPPKATSYYSGRPIDVGTPQNTTLDGRVKARIKYGRSGLLKYQAEASFGVSMKFDENGRLTAFNYVLLS